MQLEKVAYRRVIVDDENFGVGRTLATNSETSISPLVCRPV
jgi:hypothetical protein